MTITVLKKIATKPNSNQTDLSMRSIWMLKIPHALRDPLVAGFPSDHVIFPSVRHPDGSLTNRIPSSLFQRMLDTGPDVVALWNGLSLLPEEATALEARGTRIVDVSPARLHGPLPEPGFLTGAYGIRFEPADPDFIQGPLGPAKRLDLLARYQSLQLTAVSEAGPVELPVQARALLKTPGIMVVAAENTCEVTELASLTNWLDILSQARRENPGQTIIFVTNGTLPPEENDPLQAAALAEIREMADIICSERWNHSFLKYCRALYTDAASAALDAYLADLRVVVRQPGPLQDLVAGSLAPQDAFAEHLLEDTIFIDPVHGRVLPRELVMDVIAHRRTLLPAMALPASMRWPQATPTPAPEDNLAASIGTEASYSPIDPTKVLPAAKALIPPKWLQSTLMAPDCPENGLLMLQGDRGHVRALNAQDGTLPPIVELTLHPTDNLAQLDDFAQYQPVLYMQLVRRLIRQSGARKALICDLVSPAVRLFARACALERVERAWLPTQITLPPAAAGLRSLCDVVFVWHPDIRSALIEAATVPSEMLQDIELGTQGEAGSEAVLWLDQTGMTLARLKTVITESLKIAELMDISITVILGQDALARFDTATFERLAFNPRVTYHVLGLDPDLPAAILAKASLVLTQSMRIRALADQLGCMWQPLAPDTDIKIAGPALAKHIRMTILDWCDSEKAEKSGLIIDHSTVQSGLQGWISNKMRHEPTSFFPDQPKIAISVMNRSALENEARYIMQMLSVERVCVFENRLEPHNVIDADIVFKWGLRNNKRKISAEEVSRALFLGIIYLEDGFFRSVEIGLTGAPTLSVVLDSKTPFYDATEPSQLEDLINAAHPMTELELNRVRALIDRITKEKVTKYNFAPYRLVARTNPARPVIVVVDQRAGDMSIEKGLANELSFAQMVDTALEFSETHDILIKTHPDANIGGRESAIGAGTLRRAEMNPAVTLITEDMNPYSLIDIAEKVFVVSSGMGFEALLAKRQVWCFGAPFYAGWGLTKDHIATPRRTSKPSIEELFHSFCIKQSIYYDPITSSRGEIETTIDFIVKQRPWHLKDYENIVGNEESRVFNVKHPPTKAVWCFGIHKWKRELLQKVLKESELNFAESSREFLRLRENGVDSVLVWGYNRVPGLQKVVRELGLPLMRMEDGFLRSVGLGANHVLPYSLCIDSRGLYFDPRTPSDLEHILQTYDFAADPELLPRAKAARERIVETGLSKYNFPIPRRREPYGPKNRRRVLVIGQVEDDASIRFGAPGPITNNDLVRLARQENPEAQVIYRIHPDVLEGKRPELSDPADVKDICEISADRLALADAFDEVDQVYTITSLAGFEALMRGIPVTAVGMPFYAGWGLTDDRATCARRTRKLTLDELFAGAYILYPHYFDPATGVPLEIEQVIDALLRDLVVPELAAL